MLMVNATPYKLNMIKSYCDWFVFHEDDFLLLNIYFIAVKYV